MSIAGVDSELSGELDSKLIDEINKRIDGKEQQFNQALIDNNDHEGAIQSLCAEIYTDMTQVEKEIAQPEGLVSLHLSRTCAYVTLDLENDS